MKRKIWAALLAVLLVWQLSIPTANAGGGIYFTAAGGNVLPLSDSTMPFWHDGYLYIPGTMFTDNVWRALGVSYIRNNRDVVILHNAGQAAGRSLLFEPGKAYAKDSNGNVHQPGVIERGGIAFVPAFLVAAFFGLEYSVIDVPRGNLVWLRKPDFGLSAKYFADAATSNMEDVYATYMRGKEEKPEQPEVTPESPSAPGAGIYLCMEAGENTAAILDVLEYDRSYAAFFCAPSFLEQQGDLLRRMISTGHTAGILVDSAAEQTVEEQLEAGNRALEQATCWKTRLAYVKNGSEEDIRRVRDAGYICFEPDINRAGYKLSGKSDANSLMRQISPWKSSVTVWLGGTADQSGLRHFLTAVERAEDWCLALTETEA